MLYYSRAKIIAILGSVLLAILLALPNVLPADYQKWFKDNTIARPMTLGLDLQGGANVLMEVDPVEFKATLIKQLMGDIRATLRDQKVAYKGLQRTENGVQVTLADAGDVAKVEAEMKKLVQPVTGGLLSGGGANALYTIQQNGAAFSYSFNPDGFDAKVTLAIEQIQRIMENRINGLGVAEASIQQQGKSRIVIQMPGVKEPGKVIEAIGKTAKLTFQLLCESQPRAKTDRPPPDCDALPVVEKNPGAAEIPDDQLPVMWVQTSAAATVDGADLTDAQPSFDQNNRSVVSFKFNLQGAQKFGRLTSENVNKPFAIILDNKVLSSPVINEPILGGAGQISGNFSVEETTSLSVNLRSGALPARLKVVEERTVGPSLGSDSIRAGFIASVIGLIGVMIFMLVAYGVLGIFANIALVVNLIIIIALMSVLGFTLTLPGIAAIVLTMGVAVDANVLIYERIREEWRNGRSVMNAIETGFKAAWGTILDANFTSFIAAAVLFGVGSGPVRGFAVAHALGILTTVYTAFTLTRLIVAWWVKTYKPKEIPL